MVKLVPLKMKITDMNNKPLDYVDVSLVGSNFWYKIVFTNSNPVGVNILYVGGMRISFGLNHLKKEWMFMIFVIYINNNNILFIEIIKCIIKNISIQITL